MADEKLKKFALKLRDEVQTLAGRVSQVEKVRAMLRDGRDGEHGDAGARGERGQDGERGAGGAQGAPGRDGRDGVTGERGDGVTRVEVEQDNMLAVWVGEVKTLAGRIVTQVGAQGAQGPKGDKGDKGDKGLKGRDGADGRAGASITKVELKGRELFVWLDGVKKKAGSITLPSLGAGGGGSTAALSAQIHKTRLVYGAMSITQRDRDDPSPNVIAVLPHPGGTDEMHPPAAPVAVGPGPFGGYYRVDAYLPEGANKEVTVSNAELNLPVDGVYQLPNGWATFRHSANGATVGFTLAIERDGFLAFSQRPVSNNQANNNKLTVTSASGQLQAQAGDKMSVWIASDVAGNVTMGNSVVLINMLEDTSA